MTHKAFFALASLLALFAHDGAHAQTRLSLTQLPSCTATSSTSATPIVMALVANIGGAPTFVCYAFPGVTITPASGTTPATINLPATTFPTFVDGETPKGTIDGINPTFTLANTPNPLTSLHLYLGLRMAAGNDYTIAGNAITFVAASIPQPGAVMVADYRY